MDILTKLRHMKDIVKIERDEGNAILYATRPTLFIIWKGPIKRAVSFWDNTKMINTFKHRFIVIEILGLYTPHLKHAVSSMHNTKMNTE